MSFSKRVSHKEIEEAQQHARELIELFKAWVIKRKETLKQLEQIAKELDKVSQNVNVAKLTGTTAAAVGGVATVAGIGATFLTGGLAAPLIGWGIAGTVAGTVTSSGADIVGQYISKEKMAEAQKIMDEEAKLSSEIEQKKANLDVMVDRLSASLELNRDEVLGMLLLTNFITNLNLGRFPGRLSPATSMILLYAAVSGTTLVLTRTTFEAVGKGMARTVFSISLEGLTKIVQAVLKGVALGVAGFILAWDIYQWVKITIDIAEGSKSAAAGVLRKIAAELKKQMEEIEEWLKSLEEQAKDCIEEINKRFRKILKRISRNGCATQAEKEEVWQYVQYYADSDWKNAFLPHLHYENYTFHLARVFHILYNKVKHYQEEQEEEKKDLKITVIGHGSIDLRLRIPCLFYYLNPLLKKVTLYEPWGCAIDATVVYGITTNTIRIGRVTYSGEVLPCRPSDWNDLPRDMITIPDATLTPVKVGEPAYEDLMWLFSTLQGSSDGLVIPYFQGLEIDLLPFPTIPLWVICNVLALIGILRGSEVSIRVAACLSVDDPNSVSGHVPCSQYCTVDGSARPPVFMTCDLRPSPTPSFLRQLKKLNSFL